MKKNYNEDKIKIIEKRFGESLSQAAIRMFGRDTNNTRSQVKMCVVCGRFCTNNKCQKCFRTPDAYGRIKNAACFNPKEGLIYDKFNENDKIMHIGKIGGDICIIHNYYGGDK